MIPKLIHYCWFGRREKPTLEGECIKSWSRLESDGYKIVEWNETNCNLDENIFVRTMYEKKKYAFVSDYFRLKALNEHGGIYLDTDVYVYRSFDPLLKCGMFLGFIYDCALGTAVIGAEKGSGIVCDIMRAYGDSAEVPKDIVNNGLFTEYFYESIPGFVLNGKRQSIKPSNGEGVEIYPKETFETGKILGRSYTLHFADGSWGNHSKKTSPRLKLLAARLPVNLMSVRQHQKAAAFMKREGKYQKWYREETSQ